MTCAPIDPATLQLLLERLQAGLPDHEIFIPERVSPHPAPTLPATPWEYRQ